MELPEPEPGDDARARPRRGPSSCFDAATPGAARSARTRPAARAGRPTPACRRRSPAARRARPAPSRRGAASSAATAAATAEENTRRRARAPPLGQETRRWRARAARPRAPRSPRRGTPPTASGAGRTGPTPGMPVLNTRRDTISASGSTTIASSARLTTASSMRRRTRFRARFRSQPAGSAAPRAARGTRLSSCMARSKISAAPSPRTRPRPSWRVASHSGSAGFADLEHLSRRFLWC